MTEQSSRPNETARIEAFSDGVFAIAITLLILEIQVPPQTPHGGLRAVLFDLWPSYLAFLASFMTIGVMWLNHHRLFTLINKRDDGLIAFNLQAIRAWTHPVRRAPWGRVLRRRVVPGAQRALRAVFCAPAFAVEQVSTVNRQ